MSRVKSFLKHALILALIASIPLSIAWGMVLGSQLEHKVNTDNIIDVVSRFREVPEYETIELWYEIPSRQIWISATRIDMLSGTVSQVAEPMKGYWKGERRVKLVCKRFDGGEDHIELTQGVKG